MATTKKGTASKKAPAGARTDATKSKANGVASAKTKANPEAKETKTPQAASNTRLVASAASKPAMVKLTNRQSEFLKKIHDAGESGYNLALKVEQRTIEALVERKLVKRGAKNKETGQPRFLLTKAGVSHLPTVPPPAVPAAEAPASLPPAEPATTA
jgi:hypothetical protein